MTFNTDQAGMAIFLLVAAIFNGWFVVRSLIRSFCDKRQGTAQDLKAFSPRRYQLLTYAVLAMALFDVLWVWLCMIQCWNNTLTEENSFHQSSGDDSFGCKFMGWYSSFSLVSMMGSHCLVAYYLMNLLNKKPSDGGDEERSFSESTRGFLCLTMTLLIGAALFASMPLMEGDGYRLTNGGFCYADFTNTAQASIILSVVLVFLGLATALWIKIGLWRSYWHYFTIFFITWILWVPATSYGIATGEEIASPYMIIGAIVGHSNAIINPLLYGYSLFRSLQRQSDDKRNVSTQDFTEMEP